MVGVRETGMWARWGRARMECRLGVVEEGRRTGGHRVAVPEEHQAVDQVSIGFDSWLSIAYLHSFLFDLAF